MNKGITTKNNQNEKRGLQTFANTEPVYLFPSICELAGIDIPDYAQGNSFMPFMDNPDQTRKSAALSQFHRRPRASADGKRYMGYSINIVAQPDSKEVVSSLSAQLEAGWRCARPQ